ncbi:Gfo/Idh/MocA family protein [Streptomyces sp. NPDC048172]|uniref:Gfo/Idh/MocA family protein n=1 Tax=Streptomyces sp. NPDC048172 TaxID=3365505 RepID=UPI00371CAA68
MRIGALGAADITPIALIRPARAVKGVEVAAVAARDRDRARRFAARHRVPTVHGSYDDLLADPSLDAVYVPLPHSLHAQWTVAALKAGKHVLCEKPFTSNAAQAREIAAAAQDSGLVVMEALHYRYHPRTERMMEIVRSGELGRVRRVETTMCVPLPLFSDIRYDFHLGGGALTDLGCYAVHCLRLLASGEPEVTAAEALPFWRDRRVDRAVTARFRLPGGAVGRIHASLWSSTLYRIRARVIGDRGTMTASNFVVPSFPMSRFTVTAGGRRRRERVRGESTHTHQLRAFAAAVRGEPANLTPPADSIVTMELIDDIYTAAGLPVRP